MFHLSGKLAICFLYYAVYSRNTRGRKETDRARDLAVAYLRLAYEKKKQKKTHG